MTITQHPVTEAGIRRTLRWLARTWDGHKAAVRELLLGAYTDQTVPWSTRSPCVCGKCLQCIWEAYQHDLALLDGLNGEAWAERRHWHEIDPGLAGCGDAEGEAIHQVEMLIAGHEDVLIYGPRGKRAGAA